MLEVSDNSGIGDLDLGHWISIIAGVHQGVEVTVRKVREVSIPQAYLWAHRSTLEVNLEVNVRGQRWRSTLEVKVRGQC